MTYITNLTPAYLVLEDGTVLEGKSFGSSRSIEGEVVFNTAMTGYQEILSDPSYCGQIVVMTYPLIGNYGLNQEDFESLSPAINGLIVKEYCDFPSHWRQQLSLDAVLKEKNIPGMYGIDTRHLTRLIRQHGSMKGKMYINSESFDSTKAIEEVRAWTPRHDQIKQVSTKSTFQCPGRGKRIAMLDFGSKSGILRELAHRHCDVLVLPYDTSAEEILRWNPEGVVLSNGPGDPKDVPETLDTIRTLLGKVPLLGICMGHQLFALAAGADTQKMKFGHRGANHPVQDVETKQVMITSQNHSYTVALDSIANTRLKVTHLAVNDQTVEGLKHQDVPAFSVQFHPEAAPGPWDSQHLFDHFLKMVEEQPKKEGLTHAKV